MKTEKCNQGSVGYIYIYVEKKQNHISSDHDVNHIIIINNEVVTVCMSEWLNKD